MVVSLTVNGSSFSYPELSDEGWGIIATAWAAAISSSTLQKSGGTFTLTAEVDFGANYGLKSLYYKSRTASPATAGQYRLAASDVVSWRNTSNNANLDLSVNSNNQLVFNGDVLLNTDEALVGSNGITVTSGSNTTDIAGFRSEFVAASGSLQSQIGSISLGAIKAIVSDSALLVVTTGTNTVTLSPDTTPSFTSVTATTITGTTGQFGGALSAGSFSTAGSAAFTGGLGDNTTTLVVNGNTRDHRQMLRVGSSLGIGMISYADDQPGGVRTYEIGGTEASPAAVPSGTILGVTAAYAYDGTDQGQSARMCFVAKKTATNNSTPGRIDFDTASEGSSTNTTRVSIDDDGVNIHKHDLYEVQDIRSETGAFTHGLTVSGIPVPLTGGAGTPGGSDTQVQFNDSGSFGGDSGLTFNKTTDTLTSVIISGTTGQFGGNVSAQTITIDSGAVGTPSLSFGSDSNTGIYLRSADRLGIVTGGTDVIDCNSTTVNFPGFVRLADGSAASPTLAFTQDGNTGVYRIGAEIIGVSAGGASRLTISGANATTSGIGVDGHITSQFGDFSRGLTISGAPVMSAGITGITISGSTLTKGQIDVRGSRGGNVSFSNGTLFFDAPPAGTGGGGSGITAIVQDTTPKLGGNLDVNGFNITNAAGTTTVGVTAAGDINLSSADDISITANGAAGTIDITTLGASGNMTISSSANLELLADADAASLSISATGAGGTITIAGNTSISIDATVVTGTEFRTGGTVRAETGNFKNLSGMKDSIILSMPTTTTGVVYLEASAPYAYTILNATGFAFPTGTISGTLKKNAQFVTGIENQTWSTVASTKTATGNNTVAVGDTVSVVLSGTSRAGVLSFGILYS